MNSFQKRLLELVRFLQDIESDTCLSNYERLVHEKASELHEKLFVNIYKVYEPDILAANFEWLQNKEIKISFGKSGKSCIRLSYYYKKANMDQKVQIEALLVHCIKECLNESHEIDKVCKKYVQEDISSQGGKDLFGNIISKLKNKFEESGINASQDVKPEDMGKVITTLMSDQQLQQQIHQFAQQVNLPALLGNLFQAPKQ